MRSIVLERFGEPSEVLALVERPDPRPGPGQALVRVTARPVHPSDLHITRGRYGVKPPLPTSPGLECVGVVEAVGPGVEDGWLGRRVVPFDVWQTWQDLLAVDVARLLPVADAVPDAVAAQAIVNPLTAFALVLREHRMQPGEWLLQTAAGSTVGRLVLQLAGAVGFRTINVVRRREQVAELKALGADEVICSADHDIVERVREITGGAGVSKALDCVGGQVGADVVRALAPGGAMLQFGALSSHRQTLPEAFTTPVFSPRLIYDAATLRGWWLYHWIRTMPLPDAMAAAAQVLALLEQGVLGLPESRVYPFASFLAAIEDAEGMGRIGKPLLADP